MSRARLAAGGAIVMLGGCSLAPHTLVADPPVPLSWPAGDAYLARAEADVPVLAYTDVFRDPRLHALVTQALANNRDLRIAAANLAAARAQVRVVRSAQFPEVGVTASGSYDGTGGGGASSDVTGGDRIRASGGDFALQGGVSSFELDLFGRLASATAAQRQRALASEASARTVRLGLVGDLANAWATYAYDADLLAIARDTLAAASRGVAITRARLEGGIAPRTDLSQALQIEATARGDAARQITALAQDANLVRLLVGADVDPALLPGGLDQAIASTSAPPAGTSSRVLLRRPDVVEAEYDLRAADFDIGVARAELFPTISLSALAGFVAGGLGSLFHHDSFEYSAGGNGGYTVFDAGGRRANVRVSEAQRDAALATYERAIQTAFREVADALAQQGTLDAQLAAARANTAAAADTARLTEARYRGGIDSYLASLDAQRSLYGARRTEAAVRLALVTNRVTLYRTLGGDQATAMPSPASQVAVPAIR